MTWAIPLAMVLIAVASFSIAAVYMETPPKPKQDFGQAVNSLPMPSWDGMTYEHPGMSYQPHGHGRHRRL